MLLLCFVKVWSWFCIYHACCCGCSDFVAAAASCKHTKVTNVFTESIWVLISYLLSFSVKFPQCYCTATITTRCCSVSELFSLLMSTGELHVTPLTGILQMRPSFSYLDKADNKTREREAANEGVFVFNLNNWVWDFHSHQCKQSPLHQNIKPADISCCITTGFCLQVETPPRTKLKKRPRPSLWELVHTHMNIDSVWLNMMIIDQFFTTSVPLQVRFARPESEQARQRRIQSYEFLQKKQAEEPWVHLHYHSVKVGGTWIVW